MTKAVNAVYGEVPEPRVYELLNRLVDLGDMNATAKAGNIEVFLGVKYNVVYYLTTDVGDIDINLLPSLHVVVTLPGVMASPPVIYAEAKVGSVKVNYV